MIRYYHAFLSPDLLRTLWTMVEPVPSLESMRISKGLQSRFLHIETLPALSFVAQVYTEMHDSLDHLLKQRGIDRAFMDQQTLQNIEANIGVDFQSPDYKTVINAIDDNGRIVLGPSQSLSEISPVSIPSFLEGPQVTLFGPQTIKMSINAMNSFHHQLPMGSHRFIVGEETNHVADGVPIMGLQNSDY